MAVLNEMVQTGITGFCLNRVIFEKKIENFRKNILTILHDICAQAYASLGVTNQ